MATIPPPPPPPPTSSIGNPPYKAGSTPQPGHAAMPYTTSTPIQETSGSQEAPHDSQDAPASYLPTEQNGAPSPPSQGREDDLSDSEKEYHPVQETDPAPQTFSPLQTADPGEDDVITQMDMAGED
ncbi:uncharacterized protein [Embiotoca jacksoni]|uniref:uncharacterized protein n=1 Tax=Embiotoca jacksoni TaxID=100190 RepID=UPI0037042B2A